MLLFYDGAHGEPDGTVFAVLRVHVTQAEAQVATVRIGVRASRPIEAAGTNAV